MKYENGYHFYKHSQIMEQSQNQLELLTTLIRSTDRVGLGLMYFIIRRCNPVFTMNPMTPTQEMRVFLLTYLNTLTNVNELQEIMSFVNNCYPRDLLHNL